MKNTMLLLPPPFSWVLSSLCLLLLVSSLNATDPEENRTETDEAEFRQGGIGQQLMSSYPIVGGGLYGGSGAGAYQFASGSGGNAAGSGYVNMLRNLYRPPSLGLTDKVKHWVKSFMNRRQYVKPYYTPSMSSLQYSPDEFGAGKPMFIGGNSYKAISVPLRQLQKYYKPYYATEGGAQFSQQSQQASGSVPSSSILNYNPAGSGLYDFAGSNSGLFAPGSSSGSSSSNYFSQSSSASSPFAASEGGNIFSQGAFSQQQTDSNPGSALFSASGLYGGASNSGNLYQSSSSGNAGGSSGSSVFSLDGYGSDSAGAYFGTGSGSRASASTILTSGGDLYASGTHPAAASVYNPNQQGEQQQQSRGGYGSKKTAVYMPDHQRKEQQPINSFSVDSTRNSAPESASYSVAFQPSAQANSGFQPVSFASDFQGKSS